ncbi:MAG: histidinol-phosphate transaminase [Acetivibrionales bacterium]|jgi:histidinol-phosphate aminotransferase|nr:histidinol-phosphate transaminase [Bacillota bacterium]
MDKYLSRLARGLVPYVPGEQPGDGDYIKLNTNENPYGPSPKVLEAIRRETGEKLRLYPDPTCDALVNAAAAKYGVKKDQVFTGNGSDEILAFSFMAFFDPDRPIMFPDITYSFYPVYASLFGIDYVTVPVDSGFDIRPEQLMNSSGGVVIANPNAPTGIALPLSAIRRILDGNPDTVVIVDEAYIDFGGQSAVSLIDEYPNLLVVHTFSKSRALAGMRIGLAFGDSGLIRALEKVKNSFNSYTLDRLALAAGVAALEDDEYYRVTVSKVKETREWFTAELRKRDFSVTDSSANFVFASHRSVRAEDLFRRLREKRILVRYFKKPKIDNHLRITIGTDEDMRTVIDVLDRIL